MNRLLNAGILFGLVISMAACGTAVEEAEEPEGEAVATPAPTPAAPPAATSAPAPARQAAPAPQPTPQPAAPAAAQNLAPTATAARVFEVPAGTALSFTLIDSLSTETNKPGDTFQASLTEALVLDGVTVVPRNAIASGRVLAVDEPGRVQGRARIELIMTDIHVGEQSVAIQTVPFVAEAESTQTEDATKIGVGAGIGAVIGGLLGGGGGAAKGAAIGGGAGTGVVLATKGDQIVYPSETKLEFTLGEPMMVVEGGTS